MAVAYVQLLKGQILNGVTLSVQAHGKRASSHVKGRDVPVTKKQKTKTSTSGRSNKPKETDTRDRPIGIPSQVWKNLKFGKLWATLALFRLQQFAEMQQSKRSVR